MNHAITILDLVWLIIGSAIVLGVGSVGIWVLTLYAKGMSR